jgi:hypothetical protein
MKTRDRLAVVLIAAALVAASPARSQWATNPEWTLFTPANDVAFTISTPRQRYTIRERLTVNYRIVNVSGRSLYAPQRWSATCPAFPHVMAWLEDNMGRHTVSGYGGSCRPTTLSLADRMSKEGVLLKPGEHLDGSLEIDPAAGEGIAPGDYRIEATLYGWNSSGFAGLTEAEMQALPQLGAPLLRGEVPTSKPITLTN